LACCRRKRPGDGSVIAIRTWGLIFRLEGLQADVAPIKAVE
jgi:hypothetical protein